MKKTLSLLAGAMTCLAMILSNTTARCFIRRATVQRAAKLLSDFTSPVVPGTLCPHALNVVTKLIVPPGALTPLLFH